MSYFNNNLFSTEPQMSYENPELYAGLGSIPEIPKIDTTSVSENTPEVFKPLPDSGFVSLLNSTPSSQVENSLSGYLNNSFSIIPTSSGIGTSKEHLWTVDSTLDKIGGYIGTNGDTLKSIGSGLGDLAGLGNTLFGMYNANKATKMAEDAYNTQKQLTLDKWNTAKADRAEYKKKRQAAIDAYFGRTK